jgi:hypothetical protein
MHRRVVLVDAAIVVVVVVSAAIVSNSIVVARAASASAVRSFPPRRNQQQANDVPRQPRGHPQEDVPRRRLHLLLPAPSARREIRKCFLGRRSIIIRRIR